jgi:diguanylate cyclase (GGDEF)-like protein
MSRLTAYQHEPDDGGALRGVLRSVTDVDALLILLALLYLLVARGAIAAPLLYMGAIAAYGAVVLALRFAPALAEFPREKLVVGGVAMVLFVTAVVGASGGDSGPLLNLYLLPVVTSALTLGRGPTVLIVSLALACRVALGHFVAGQDVVTLGYGLALVAEAVPVLLVALLTSRLAADVADVRERLQARGDQDDLTGLLNLQAFTRLLAEERARAERRGNGFALLVVDIEGLKALNERFGHEAGDRALCAVAQALKRSSRSVDLVARYGGDEFVLYLSGAGQAVARVVANRVRHNVGTTTVEIGGSLHRVNVAIGFGVFPADGRDLRDLVSAANRALEKDRESRRPLDRDEAGLRASPARSLRA